MPDNQRDYQLLIHLIKAMSAKQDSIIKDISEINATLSGYSQWRIGIEKEELSKRITKLEHDRRYILGAIGVIGVLAAFLLFVIKLIIN